LHAIAKNDAADCLPVPSIPEKRIACGTAFLSKVSARCRRTLDLSTDVYRIFHVGSIGIDRVKHMIKPQIIYDYRPDYNKDKYPRLAGDSIDTIGKNNLITYSLTNTFTSRKIVNGISEKVVSDLKPKYEYQEFCRFKLEQSYDINKKREHNPEPFSLVSGEMDLMLSRYFTLDVDAKWSQYTRSWPLY